VVHFSRVATVVIDVPDGDHDSELSFWAAATGQHLRELDHPEYHGALLHGQDVGLLVQRLGEGTARIHLDIYTDDLDAEVQRLEHLGAQRVQQARTWWVMRDPAGLLFCVIPEPGGTLNDSNSRRWE
jgi:hypothetical protein